MGVRSADMKKAKVTSLSTYCRRDIFKKVVSGFCTKKIEVAKEMRFGSLCQLACGGIFPSFLETLVDRYNQTEIISNFMERHTILVIGILKR